MPFIVLSQRGEQDEATGAVYGCMSAVSSVWVDPCGQPCVRIYVLGVCVCIPPGNTRSDSLLAAPGGTELNSPLPACRMQQAHTRQWLCSSYSPAVRVPEVKWNK